jgi:hypothetical protein
MLMNEIANAADTLELWKMVNDKVWDSLQQLQKAEQARKAAVKKAAAKRVPPNRSVRSPRVTQTKPPLRAPQTPPPPPTALQQPKPQQMARAAAVRALPTQNSQQPQTQLPQKPTQPT